MKLKSLDFVNTYVNMNIVYVCYLMTRRCHLTIEAICWTPKVSKFTQCVKWDQNDFQEFYHNTKLFFHTKRSNFHRHVIDLEFCNSCKHALNVNISWGRCTVKQPSRCQNFLSYFAKTSITTRTEVTKSFQTVTHSCNINFRPHTNKAYVTQ